MKQGLLSPSQRIAIATGCRNYGGIIKPATNAQKCSMMTGEPPTARHLRAEGAEAPSNLVYVYVGFELSWRVEGLDGDTVSARVIAEAEEPQGPITPTLQGNAGRPQGEPLHPLARWPQTPVEVPYRPLLRCGDTLSPASPQACQAPTHNGNDPQTVS